MSNIDLNKYKDFVEAVTSKPSNDLTTFMNRCDELDGNYDTETDMHGPDINVPLLLTAALGLAAETGEFCEIPKKMFFPAILATATPAPRTAAPTVISYRPARPASITDTRTATNYATRPQQGSAKS